ncbi:MAG: S-methyl-5-thioribose-1-phosphate isomerase [Burkholderiaceae bacterium]
MNTAPVRSIRAEGDVVITLDQTRLPFEEHWLTLAGEADCDRAIRTMQVRGAPLIGAVGAYGLAFALRQDASDTGLVAACARLELARPTAVNLHWALERVRSHVAPLPTGNRAQAAWAEAQRLCDDDVACNRAIGEHLLSVLPRASVAGRPLQILTHCNAGRLATVAYGTALAPIYLLHERGIAVHVWVDETRPRNQGASLTAWELAERGIAHTVIADNAGGLLMMRGDVDAVIVGCDRVTRNGDVVNKVGTYLKALAAHAHGVPFFVACPISTIDMRLADGLQVPIEDRDGRELSHVTGIDAQGRQHTVDIMPGAQRVANPAFDITPAALVTALVTERGACRASAGSLANLAAA